MINRALSNDDESIVAPIIGVGMALLIFLLIVYVGSNITDESSDKRISIRLRGVVCGYIIYEEKDDHVTLKNIKINKDTLPIGATLEEIVISATKELSQHASRIYVVPSDQVFVEAFLVVGYKVVEEHCDDKLMQYVVNTA